VKKDPSKPPGIKQIATALGISIGTVDRALHDRPGVNAQTRAKVLKLAEQLNYRPNIAARSLKLNRNLRIAVHLPEQIASFYDLVRDGINAAAADSLGVPVEVNFKSYPGLGGEDLELLAEDATKNYDGIILSPGNPRGIDPLLREFAARGTQVMCVVVDAPRSPRLASVCADAYVGGSIAAELLAMKLAQPGSVAIATGDVNILDHAEKLRGFAATLAVMAPHLQLLPAMESRDQPELAYRNTLALLARKTHPAGIYVCTTNSIPVIRAIEERGLLGQIQVVATDLFPELISLIETGGILATLNQRPFTQGKMASKPNLLMRLAPHIVIRANLPLFSGR
jgi:LacI family transcriptional regulator